MRELEILFGQPFPLESIVDLRVRRFQAKDVAARALVGSQPTHLTLTLADGRRLERSSRGPGPERDAIEAVVARVAAWKADEALRAIAGGGSFAFGPVTLSPVGIQHAGQLTAWDGILGFAVRQGGLVWDDARGRLAGEVLLPHVPFADGLCLAIARRLPGKDYARMPAGEGPQPGFFAITARTRIPGTFRYQKHLFLGVIPLVLLALGVAYVAQRASVMAGRPPAAKGPDPYLAWIDDAAAALRTPAAVASAPPCSASGVPHGVHLVAADRSSVWSKGSHRGSWNPAEARDLRGASSFFAWTTEGPSVRVVRWEPATRKAVCTATAAIVAGEPPEKAAQWAAEGLGPRR